MGRFLDIAMPWANDQMSMDVEHALMIGEFIRRMGVNTAVEVGCCYGISTGAVLDSFDAHRATRATYAAKRQRLLHLIDPQFKQSVLDMDNLNDIEPVEDFKIVLDEWRSDAVRPDGSHVLGDWQADMVILDGDHSVQAVDWEVRRLLDWHYRPWFVVLHDTGVDGLDGPRHGVEVLFKAGYNVTTNDDRDLGARTGRGLTICDLPSRSFGSMWGYNIAREVLKAK
jgi:hypothetical protein